MLVFSSGGDGKGNKLVNRLTVHTGVRKESNQRNLFGNLTSQHWVNIKYSQALNISEQKLNSRNLWIVVFERYFIFIFLLTEILSGTTLNFYLDVAVMWCACAVSLLVLCLWTNTIGKSRVRAYFCATTRLILNAGSNVIIIGSDQISADFIK